MQVLERTYRISGIERTKAGPVLVLSSPHDTLKIAVEAREAEELGKHLRETVKLSLTLSRPSSVPPPSSSSKIRG